MHPCWNDGSIPNYTLFLAIHSAYYKAHFIKFILYPQTRRCRVYYSMLGVSNISKHLYWTSFFMSTAPIIWWHRFLDFFLKVLCSHAVRRNSARLRSLGIDSFFLSRYMSDSIFSRHAFYIGAFVFPLQGHSYLGLQRENSEHTTLRQGFSTL